MKVSKYNRKKERKKERKRHKIEYNQMIEKAIKKMRDES